MSAALFLTSLSLIAAATGTAGLLRASGVDFDALRIAGIAYLLLMAIAAWRYKSELLVLRSDQVYRSKPPGTVL